MFCVGGDKNGIRFCGDMLRQVDTIDAGDLNVEEDDVGLMLAMSRIASIPFSAPARIVSSSHCCDR